MDVRHIVHPKIFMVNGIKYKIAALCSLTDEQAQKILMLHLRQYGQKKKDRGKLQTIVTIFDENSLAIL